MNERATKEHILMLGQHYHYLVFMLNN